jgi:hypothetical protein
VEVLYHPRGFADRMSTLLWQDSTQGSPAPEVFMELSRRGLKTPGVAPPAAPVSNATARRTEATDRIPLKLRITPDSAGLSMTPSFESAGAVCAKEESQ